MRFYITFRSGDVFTTDEEGLDAPSLKEAQAAAMASARELIGEAIARNGETIVDEVIITDESGKTLLRFSGKDVLPETLR